MNELFTLKAQLLFEGINISNYARESLNKASEIWLMDDYITCSGVTLNFETEYATVKYCPNASHLLDLKDNTFVIVNGEGKEIKANVIVPPNYMKDEIIIEGKSITHYVNTYTDRVRIQLTSGCTNACKFCNAKEFNYEFNSVEGLEKALQIALGESNVRHALLSSGNVYPGEDMKRLTDAYEFFCRKHKDLEIDLMTPPRGFDDYKNEREYSDYILHLKKIGIHGLSINIELNSSKMLEFFCPEKAEIGQRRYLDFIEKAVNIFGKNKVRSLIIVGLEPIEETMLGVEKLAALGCNPVLSPLFPYGEAQGYISTELFIDARKRAEDICSKYKIQLGPICNACSHNTL